MFYCSRKITGCVAGEAIGELGKDHKLFFSVVSAIGTAGGSVSLWKDSEFLVTRVCRRRHGLLR